MHFYIVFKLYVREYENFLWVGICNLAICSVFSTMFLFCLFFMHVSVNVDESVFYVRRGLLGCRGWFLSASVALDGLCGCVFSNILCCF